MLKLSVGFENLVFLPLIFCNLEFAMKTPNNVLMMILNCQYQRSWQMLLLIPGKEIYHI